MKKYLPAILMWSIFEIIAVVLWLMLDNIFYFFNFTYIGSAIGAGLVLYTAKKKYARCLVQFLVGTYMLVYLGIICRENMQISGFWYYLFLGVFEAAVIHYAVAKIFGPLVFGRGWCGYACWTAMILDLLPFRTPEYPRRKWGYIRYIVFAASLCFTALLFVSGVQDKEYIIWISFIAGNVLYYLSGIVLAFVCRDNRAFCKYICPVTVFLKPASYFSLMRIRLDEEKCISCGMCAKVCPMDVELPSDSRNRVNGTECILCMKCIDVCPKKALHL